MAKKHILLSPDRVVHVPAAVVDAWLGGDFGIAFLYGPNNVFKDVIGSTREAILSANMQSYKMTIDAMRLAQATDPACILPSGIEYFSGKADLAMLSPIAMRFLVIPLSNSDCERGFSAMNRSDGAQQQNKSKDLIAGETKVHFNGLCKDIRI